MRVNAALAFTAHLVAMGQFEGERATLHLRSRQPPSAKLGSRRSQSPPQRPARSGRISLAEVGLSVPAGHGESGSPAGESMPSPPQPLGCRMHATLLSRSRSEETDTEGEGGAAVCGRGVSLSPRDT